MKKASKILIILFVVAMVAMLALGLVACNVEDYSKLRFTAPEGTPALAMLRLAENNLKIGKHEVQYNVIGPSSIASEMRYSKSDIIIMPVNGGANLIRTGTADYKLVSIAVDGSLYMIGRKTSSDTITVDDIKGKKIACIGQEGVPGLVFRYVMANNGLEVITTGIPDENQVLVQYVNDATYAQPLLADNQVDFAVVGEPAATQFKNLFSLNAEMDMQLEYSRVNPTENGDTYPQAGLFVRTSLANDEKFMSELFTALANSKRWVAENPAMVQNSAKKHLYDSAKFPEASISRCAINCNRLDENTKNRIIAFLKNVMPAVNGNPIDWDSAKALIF